MDTQFVEMGSCSITQAVGQWCDHSTLRPQTLPGLKRSSHLSLPSGQEYRPPIYCRYTQTSEGAEQRNGKENLSDESVRLHL
ncbi:PREDICTED: BEN domain-containing protein 2-like [Rhinopithecus bieti]|uniref:BEN domain-containing protein 2-like n=1 Tax=Rhinopithecus bieti TaxID=61621 RepID=UPI00083C813A|nr:PREDICTED: BEN domain-containing protein 2-like [Rhinopithecus bieti]